MRTGEKNGAGTHAVFNESFELELISEAVLKGEEVVFQLWDIDTLDENLGSSRPFMWQDFLQDQQVNSHTLELYNRQNVNTGTLKLET